MIVWAYAAGRQVGFENVFGLLNQGNPSEAVIRLGPASDMSVVVLDPKGRPRGEALVEPGGVNVQTRLYGLFMGLPHELLARVAVHTDAEGCAKLPAFVRDLLFGVRITTKDLGVQMQQLSWDGPPTFFEPRIRLQPVGKIKGELIADRPEVVRGVRMIFTTQGYGMGNNVFFPKKAAPPSPPWPADGFAEAKTDERGRFVVPIIAHGDLLVEVRLDEDLPLRPIIPDHLTVSAGLTTNLEFHMVPTVPVRGSIRAKDTGKPIAGALIHIYYGVHRQGADAVSDAQGRFAARVLPGRVGLQVIYMPEKYAHPGNGPTRPYVVPAGAKVFDLPPLEIAPSKEKRG